MKQQQNNVGSVISALHVLYSTCRPNLGVIFSLTLVFDASVKITNYDGSVTEKRFSCCWHSAPIRPEDLLQQLLSPFSGCVPNPASASYEVQVLCLPKSAPILLPSKQWDGLAFVVFPVCFTAVLLPSLLPLANPANNVILLRIYNILNVGKRGGSRNVRCPVEVGSRLGKCQLTCKVPLINFIFLYKCIVDYI